MASRALRLALYSRTSTDKRSLISDIWASDEANWTSLTSDDNSVMRFLTSNKAVSPLWSLVSTGIPASKRILAVTARFLLTAPVTYKEKYDSDPYGALFDALNKF